MDHRQGDSAWGNREGLPSLPGDREGDRLAEGPGMTQHIPKSQGCLELRGGVVLLYKLHVTTALFGGGG